MILLLIKSAQPFRINDYNRKLFIQIGIAVKDFPPDPETLSTRINGGAHIKSFHIIPLLLNFLHE